MFFCNAKSFTGKVCLFRWKFSSLFPHTSETTVFHSAFIVHATSDCSCNVNIHMEIVKYITFKYINIGGANKLTTRTWLMYHMSI